MKKSETWTNIFLQNGFFKKVLMVMKITVFIFLLTISSAFAKSSYSQNTRLTLHLENATIQKIFDEIQKKSEFIIFYKDDQVDLNHQSNVDVENATVDQILDQALKGTDLGYRIMDRQIVISTDKMKELPSLLKSETIAEQKREISGTVKDTKGLPLPGVSVVFKGTTIGIITDADGKFRLPLTTDVQILVFSFIGMKTQEITIAGKTFVTVVLSEQAVGVEEVVVVGYGTQKKVTVMGAISTVGTSQLLSSPVSNISNSLGGRMPGLLVVQRSGEPGADASTLRIRGVGTFSGSQEPLVLIDGIESTTMNDLDPNEVESLTVLKDASATAVYGVRGANGVILVTTKRGKVGKPQFSITSNFAMNQFTDFRERMEAEGYARYVQEQRKYDSYFSGNYTPLFTEDDFRMYRDGSDPIWHPNANWVDIMLKPVSFQQQHNLNIRGGTEKVKYFISGGFFDQGGLLRNTKIVPGFAPHDDVQLIFKRYNIRTNFDFKVTKRLSFIVNVSSQFEQRNGPPGGNAGGLLRGIALANPIAMPGVIDGKFVSTTDTKFGIINPLFEYYSGGFVREFKNYLDGTFRANYLLDFITQGLSLHGTLSYKNYNLQTLRYSRGFPRYTAIMGTTGKVELISASPNYSNTGISSSANKNRYVYMEAGLDYSKTFGVHTLSGMLLYNQSQLNDPGLQYVIPSGYQGIVGRVVYDYNSRYLAEFDFGYNGTENFAPGKRFGFFPAASVGWVLSEEPFFPKNKIVSFVKLRATYGEVGNDKIGGSRFLYLPNSYSYYTNAYFYGITGSNLSPYQGSAEGKIGNPNITWERAKKTNLGIDLTLLKDKLKITADVFRENRNNILITRNTIPTILGGGSNLPADNMGKMKNRGFDGEITYNGKAGNLNYRISANYTYAVNQIIYQDEVPSAYPYLYSTGQRYGQLFGSIDNGLYNSWQEVNDAYRPRNAFNNNRIMPGDINYRDINGDGVYDGYDQAPIGYPNFPEKMFGLSASFDFKGFDLSFLFQGSSNVTFNASGNYIFGNNQFGDVPQYLENSWTQERYQTDQLITFPRPSNPANQSLNFRMGTFYAKDASYLRLRNIEFGYTFQKTSFIRVVGLSSSRIYLNASNLLTLTPGMHKMFPGTEPENIGTYANNEPYPRTTAVNLGININF
jgi:TonB-linked SusC/RagA family outer membrane protein